MLIIDLLSLSSPSIKINSRPQKGETFKVTNQTIRGVEVQIMIRIGELIRKVWFENRKNFLTSTTITVKIFKLTDFCSKSMNLFA